MNKLKATSAIMIDSRRIKQDGSYPLKLRITYNRERRYHGIGRDVSIDDWEKLK